MHRRCFWPPDATGASPSQVAIETADTIQEFVTHARLDTPLRRCPPGIAPAQVVAHGAL